MAQRMTYKKTLLGLGQFANADIAVFGGTSTGKFGTEGTARLRYVLFDMAAILAGTPPDDAKFGECELNVVPAEDDADWRIEGIVDIEVDRAKRGRGYGRRAVEAIAATAADEVLNIYDIQGKARGFWQALGCIPSKRQGGAEFDGEIANPCAEASPKP